MLGRLFALVAILIIISGCCCFPSYEPISEDKGQFVGRWVSDDDQILTIRANGSGDFDGRADFSGVGGTMEVNGAAVTITEDEITIGLFGLSRTFEITRQPYEEGGNTYMELDNVLFTKQ